MPSPTRAHHHSAPTPSLQPSSPEKSWCAEECTQSPDQLMPQHSLCFFVFFVITLGKCCGAAVESRNAIPSPPSTTLAAHMSSGTHSAPEKRGTIEKSRDTPPHLRTHTSLTKAISGGRGSRPARSEMGTPGCRGAPRPPSVGPSHTTAPPQGTAARTPPWPRRGW